MPTSINNAIAELEQLDLPALRARWEDAFGRPPPNGTSRRLLTRAAAYHLQCQAFRGLSPAARRKLARIAEAPERASAVATPAPRRGPLPVGTRLVREWHGRTHTVEVIAGGVRYNGRHYRSLSEVARAITGARWSGPRFFGL